jgi:copper chaperone CopZ
VFTPVSASQASDPPAMSTETAPSPLAAPDAGSGDVAHLTLEITGMTCASCVRRVERALAGVPGVAAAGVNLAAESAGITLGRPAEPAALIAAVENAEYHAAVPAVVRPDDVARRRATQAAARSDPADQDPPAGSKVRPGLAAIRAGVSGSITQGPVA